jgi:hypothetical protein
MKCFMIQHSVTLCFLSCKVFDLDVRLMIQSQYFIFDVLLYIFYCAHLFCIL